MSFSLGVIGCTAELSPVKPDWEEAGEAFQILLVGLAEVDEPAALAGATTEGTDALLSHVAGAGMTGRGEVVALADLGGTSE
jgi:hypothetical protein